MRIVLDAVATPPSGAGLTRIVELAIAAQDRPGYEYVVVARPDVAQIVAAKAPLIQLITPPRWFASGPQRILWEQILLPRALKEHAPDLVFSPFNVLPFYGWNSDPAFAVMVSNLAPYSREMRSLCPKRRLPREIVLKKLTDASMAAAGLVLLQSKHAEQLIGDRVLRGKGLVIRHGRLMSSDVSKESLTSEREPTYFLIVAELHTHKGVDVAIRAFSRLAGNGSCRLVICGAARDRRYTRKLKRLSKSLGVDQSVDFVGDQPHEEVIRLMSSAKACIACSVFENLSRIPGEAMAAGTPVIASDIPGYRESCGEAALYFAPGDEVALAKCMHAVLQEAGLSDDLVSAGVKRLASTGSTQAAQDPQVLDALERLVVEHRA